MSASIDTVNQSDPIAWLKHDHQIIRGHLEALNGAAPSARQAELDRLKQILSLHNAIEENLVYPALANVAARQDQSMELYHQTAEADIMIDKIQRSLLTRDDAAFTTLARKLLSAILEHVRIEETQAFPLLQQAPPAEAQLLAQHILEFRQTLTSPLPAAS